MVYHSSYTKKTLPKVEIEVINLMQNKTSDFHHLHALIEDCQALLRLLDSPKLMHVMRECNKCADHLARNTRNMKVLFSFFQLCRILLRSNYWMTLNFRSLHDVFKFRRHYSRGATLSCTILINLFSFLEQ